MPAKVWDKGPAKFKFNDSDEFVAFCRQYTVGRSIQEAVQSWFDNSCVAHVIYEGLTKVVDFKTYDAAKYPEYVMKPVRAFELTQTFDRVYLKGEISVPGDYLVLSYLKAFDMEEGKYLLVSKKTGCVAHMLPVIEEGYVTTNQLDSILPEYTIFNQGV